MISSILEKNNHTGLPKVGFTGIIAAFIVIIFITPLLVRSYYANLTMHIAFIGMMLSLIGSMFNQRAAVILGTTLALPFIIINGMSFYKDSLDLLVISYLFSSLFIVSFILILAKRLYALKSVDTNLIFGVITIYILSGILMGKDVLYL